MRRHILITLLGIIVIIFSAFPLLAWKNLYNSKCPGNDPSVKWRDYMSLKVPDQPKLLAGVADVQFRFAKTVNDPEAIGNLPTNVCYQIMYAKNRPAFYGNGYFSSQPGSGKANIMKDLPGNPVEYEINVHGVLLLFNEAGEVLNRRGRVVGSLVCYGSNECGGY